MHFLHVALTTSSERRQLDDRKRILIRKKMLTNGQIDHDRKSINAHRKQFLSRQIEFDLD